VRVLDACGRPSDAQFCITTSLHIHLIRSLTLARDEAAEAMRLFMAHCGKSLTSPRRPGFVGGGCAGGRASGERARSRSRSRQGDSDADFAPVKALRRKSSLRVRVARHRGRRVARRRDPREARSRSSSRRSSRPRRAQTRSALVAQGALAPLSGALLRRWRLAPEGVRGPSPNISVEIVIKYEF
jgi:hypothetical protein